MIPIVISLILLLALNILYKHNYKPDFISSHENSPISIISVIPYLFCWLNSDRIEHLDALYTSILDASPYTPRKSIKEV